MARGLRRLLAPSEVSSLWIHPPLLAVLAVLVDGHVARVVLVSLVVIAVPTIAFLASRTTRVNALAIQRTHALDSRNHDLQRILDNVAQGFVTVSLDGAIGAERSAALDKWFGSPMPGAKWWDYVADSADAAMWLQLGFEGLRDDIMPFEAVIDQMPKRVVRGGLQLEFQYRPIGSPMTAVLAVVTDVTAEVARREAEAESRELIAVVEKATRDRTGFAGFMREASELVARSVGLDDDLATVRRNLHTLKGNAAAFGATSITELAHTLESELDTSREPLSATQRERLRAAWRMFQRRVEPLGLGQQRSVVVDREEYQRTMDAIVTKSAATEPSWLRRIRQWGMDPTRPHLVRMGEQAAALSTRLGKGDLVVDIHDNDLRIDDERFHAVWAALVHASRNAVAHGIEYPDRRRRLGKPAAPRMSLTTKLVAGDVVIEVRDDGAGVDWERVAQRAKERGLPAITRNDLDAALFAGGVSTAEQVTDISGRGVGLDALRTACIQLGGKVEIESEPDRGTVVRCTVALVQPARRRSGRTSVSA